MDTIKDMQALLGQRREAAAYWAWKKGTQGVVEILCGTPMPDIDADERRAYYEFRQRQLQQLTFSEYIDPLPENEEQPCTLAPEKHVRTEAKISPIGRAEYERYKASTNARLRWDFEKIKDALDRIKVLESREEAYQLRLEELEKKIAAYSPFSVSAELLQFQSDMVDRIDAITRDVSTIQRLSNEALNHAVDSKEYCASTERAAGALISRITHLEDMVIRYAPDAAVADIAKLAKHRAGA